MKSTLTVLVGMAGFTCLGLSIGVLTGDSRRFVLRFRPARRCGSGVVCSCARCPSR